MTTHGHSHSKSCKHMHTDYVYMYVYKPEQHPPIAHSPSPERSAPKTTKCQLEQPQLSNKVDKESRGPKSLTWSEYIPCQTKDTQAFRQTRKQCGPFHHKLREDLSQQVAKENQIPKPILWITYLHNTCEHNTCDCTYFSHILCSVARLSNDLEPTFGTNLRREALVSASPATIHVSHTRTK